MIERYGIKCYHDGIQAALDEIQKQVTYNMELNYDGTEDPLAAAYVEGVHTAYAAVKELLR